jgi:MFS family permease
MREILELLRHTRQARPFFAALAQSSLGTGAGYVGLVIIALDRFDSPWAISLILIADLGPAMLLGPLFGAIADRFSRRTCMVTADMIRAGAFLGIAFASSFELTLALAAVAGVGTGLFTPAALASLPSLVESPRLPAASALYGVLADLGYTVGPALAAGVLLLGSAESLMLANAITFALSGVVLARLSFGRVAVDEWRTSVEGQRPSLLREAREGLRATVGMVGLRTVLFASGAALFFGGLFNVGELLLATRELGTTETAYSALVALYGLGFVVGSIAGSRGGELPLLKRRYLIGVVVMGLGFVGAGLTDAAARSRGLRRRGRGQWPAARL